MTELVEGVAVGLISGEDVECPFDHNSDPLNPPVVENDFVGIGKTLGAKMAGQQGTHTPSHPGAQSKPKEDKRVNPKDQPEHPAFFSKKPITIENGDQPPHAYPVVCAAHHIIPAQASLKRAKALLRFMVWKSKSEKVKGGTVDGEVYADVGYDVNGSQNGIYLPGTYAVYGSWVKDTSVLDDESWEPSATNDDEEDELGVAANPSPSLTGRLHEISSTNRKWRYVQQAVSVCKGQYHDAHGDYSTFVITQLQKIGTQYFIRKREIDANRGCPKCQKRFDEIKKSEKDAGIPTPFALVDRLNGVSARLAGYLNGKTWTLKIYTSRWGLAYMNSLKSK